MHRAETPPSESTLEGVELSIIFAEAEPVGSFVGTSISEPLLQIGILVTVGGYLIYLQPLMRMAARKADHPLQRNETRGRSALLPTVTYATYWDTIQ
nr:MULTISPECIES: multidrug ABC transporter ATPase [Rhizobium]